MSFAFRSKASTSNGTAGTTLTITKPAGTAAGDILVALVGVANNNTVTPPAGWTLLSTVDPGVNLRTVGYWKLAGSSEAASYAWTFGASARNIGIILAYSGGRQTTPVSDFTTRVRTSTPSILTDTTNLTETDECIAVSMAIGVKAAAGSATTWTAVAQKTGGTEREDLGQNNGAGVDLALCAYDSRNGDRPLEPFGGAAMTQMAASLSQAEAVAWVLVLEPDWTQPSGTLDYTVELGLGADPDSDDPAGDWTFTDVTAYVRNSPGVTINVGRDTAQGFADPVRIALTFDNRDGRFSPFNPEGAYYPYIRRGCPLRVSVTGIGANPPYERATAFIQEWRPDWDESTRNATVAVEARGRLARISQDNAPILSPLARTILSKNPVAHWGLEDGVNATVAAESLGWTAAQTSNVDFGANDEIPGSLPVVRTNAASLISFSIPPYVQPTNKGWTVGLVVHIPEAPAGDTILTEWYTGGGLTRWQIVLQPGSGLLTTRAYDVNGTERLAASTPSGNTVALDSQAYGRAMLFYTSVYANGSNLTWDTNFSDGQTASFVSGGAQGTVVYTPGNVLGGKVIGSSGLEDAGFGHWFVLDTDASLVSGTTGYLDIEEIRRSVPGYEGETAGDRFQRLLTEQGIPFVFRESADGAYNDTVGEPPMGSQAQDTLYENLSEVDSVELGLMHDAGPYGALVLHTRESRYAADVALELDVADHHIQPGFTPSYDDRRAVNAVTASQPQGSSAFASDPEHIAQEGRYAETVQVNVSSPADLDHAASWRVHLGTVPQMRVPRLGINLRRTPELCRDFIRGGLNQRITVTGLPTGFPGDLDVFLEGYREVLSTERWELELDCSPRDPYQVAYLEDTVVGRLDTEDSELVSAVNSSATSLTVVTSEGPLWTIDDAELPFTITVGGEEMTVTDIAQTATPTGFSNGTAAHADNASVTPTMPASYSAGQLILIFAAIRNTAATVNTPSGWTRLWSGGTNVALFGKLAASGADPDPTITVSGGSSGDTVSARTARFAMGTLTDLTNIVVASATQLNPSAQNIAYPGLPLRPDNLLVLYLGWKQDDWTSVAAISGASEIMDDSSTTGNDQGIVMDRVVQTTAATILPGEFTVTGGVSAISRGAVVALLTDTQTFTVTRSANGIVKSHSAGAPVALADPMILAL